MTGYILRRLGCSCLIVLGVVFFTFLLFNLAAGDPAAAALGKNAAPREIEDFRRELGADLPLFFGRRCRTEAFPGGETPDAPDSPRTLRRAFASPDLIAVCRLSDGSAVETAVPAAATEFTLPPGCRSAEFYRLQRNPFRSQFFRALGEILHFRREFPFVEFFDFGRTITTREEVRSVIARGIGPSLALMLPVFFGEIAFGILFALIAAAWKDHLPDRLLVVLSVAGMSVSYLVVIILGQWLFGYRLGWFPLWGFEGVGHLLLPVAVGILSGIGGNLRFFRTVFVNELAGGYLRTAAAKGASTASIYGRHLLRNASLQIITRAGSGLPFLFTGSLLLESFFGIPGLGFAGVDALYNSDLQLLKAIVVMSSLLFVAINLLADLAYAWADPRVRLE